MLIEELMTDRLVTVHMDDPLSHVKHLFDTHRFHHLLVVEKNRLVGVVSDRDLFKSLSPNIGTPAETVKDTASLQKRVHQIMSRDLVTIAPDKGLLVAVKLFNRYKVSCLPVVDEQMKPLGILSWRDVFKYIEMNQAQKQFATKP
ncbi:MAG: CBS domain-containing protein [Aliiglaciecola sp.]